MSAPKSAPVTAPSIPKSRLVVFTLLILVAVILMLSGSAPHVITLLKESLPKVAIQEQNPFALAPNTNGTESAFSDLPTGYPADVCHVIGKNPDAPTLWQFNSRALCLSSSVCLNASAPSEVYLHSSDLSKTECIVSAPDFRSTKDRFQEVNEHESCAEFQRDHILCAHGDGLMRNKPKCPTILSTEGIDLHSSDIIKWFEDVTILVPSYPWPGNIYHFGNVVTWVAHVVDDLEKLLRGWGLDKIRATGGSGSLFNSKSAIPPTVNIVFRARENQNNWQASLLDVMIRYRIMNDDRKAFIHYLHPRVDSEYVCLRNAVILGRRGHVNVWPFPNSTSVPLDGMSIPVDAVDFKRAIYKAHDVNARLPARGCVRDCVSELPPLTLGYARRLSGVSSAGGNVHYAGIIRKFSASDEEWFTDMLRNETKAAGVRLHIFTTSGEDSLRAQVENIAQVGFVVGIHGANLVNSIFMQPFGALLEIFPGKAHSPCYLAGSNSGLAYYSHTSSEVATPRESGCRPDNVACGTKYRQRMVKIGSQVDRSRIQELVKNGLAHLRHLHRSYPDGIPTVYDRNLARYVIDSKTDLGSGEQG